MTRWLWVFAALLALPVELAAQSEPPPLPPGHAARIATLLSEAKLTDKYDATDLTKLIVLGDTLLDADRIEDARTAYLQAGSIQYEAVPKVVARHRLARIRAFEGEFDSAILIYRDVLAQMNEAHATSGVRYDRPFDCHMCDVVTDLAEALVALGRSEEVLTLSPEVAAIMERQSHSDALDPSGRRLSRFLAARASALESLGRWTVAEAERTMIWKMQRDPIGRVSPLGLAEAEMRLAANLGHQGKTEQALALLGTSIIAYRKLLPPLDPRLVAALGERGRVELRAAGRPQDALSSLREATVALVATGARDGKRQESRRRRFEGLFRLQVEAAWASQSAAAATVAKAAPAQSAMAGSAITRPSIASSIRHGGPVGALAFLPDGKRLVSGSLDGSVILWDYRAKRPAARFRDRAIEGIDRVEIVAGDHPIFTSYRYGPPRLWNLEGSAKPLPGEEILGALGMANNGQVLLYYRLDKVLIDPNANKRTAIEGEAPQLVVLLEASGHVALVFRGRGQDEICLSALSDGKPAGCGKLPSTISAVLPVPGEKQLIAAGDEIHLLDIPSLAIVRSMRLPAFSHPGALALSPDQTKLAAGYQDGRAVLVDFKTGAEIARLEGHNGAVAAVAFSPDSETLATASADTSIRLWSGKDGAALGVLGIEPRFARHAATIKTASFVDGGSHVISGDQDGSVRLWEIAGGTQRAVHKVEGEAGFAAVINQGKTIVTSGFSIEFRDRASGEVVRTLPRHRPTSPVVETAMTNDGYLMAADTDHFLDVFDPAGKRIGGTKLNESAYLAAAPAGDIVSFTLFGERTELWNARSARKVASLAGGILGGMFSPDGKVFARINGWRPEMFEAATGKSLSPATEEATPKLPYQQWRGGALCHRDRGLFAFSREKRFFFWPSLSGQPKEIDAGATVTALRCTPDGAIVVAGLADGDLILIDSASGVVKSRLRSHHASVTGLDISSNGSRLLSTSQDRIVRIWDLATGAEIAALGE